MRKRRVARRPRFRLDRCGASWAGQGRGVESHRADRRLKEDTVIYDQHCKLTRSNSPEYEEYVDSQNVQALEGPPHVFIVGPCNIIEGSQGVSVGIRAYQLPHTKIVNIA